jgi:hypothetical protein
VAALALILGLTLAASPPAPELRAALAEGHALFERRAEGAHGPIASPVPIDAAIAAYRQALSLSPESLEASVGLLKALFFRGGFTDADAETERHAFAEAKNAAVVAVDRLERGLSRSTPTERLAALQKVDHAAALYLWASVSWGQWAISTSKLAAARQGAASRIRELAETSIALDPELEQGSAYLILGRLHDQSPRIPFLTFWISRDAALRNLATAHAKGPHNSVAQYFLADAILHHAPERRAEARRLLAECAAAEPRPEFQVEDAHYAALSRNRLAELERP